MNAWISNLLNNGFRFVCRASDGRPDSLAMQSSIDRGSVDPAEPQSAAGEQKSFGSCECILGRGSSAERGRERPQAGGGGGCPGRVRAFDSVGCRRGEGSVFFRRVDVQDNRRVVDGKGENKLGMPVPEGVQALGRLAFAELGGDASGDQHGVSTLPLKRRQDGSVGIFFCGGEHRAHRLRLDARVIGEVEEDGCGGVDLRGLVEACPQAVDHVAAGRSVGGDERSIAERGGNGLGVGIEDDDHRAARAGDGIEGGGDERPLLRVVWKGKRLFGASHAAAAAGGQQHAEGSGGASGSWLWPGGAGRGEFDGGLSERIAASGLDQLSGDGDGNFFDRSARRFSSRPERGPNRDQRFERRGRADPGKSPPPCGGFRSYRRSRLRGRRRRRAPARRGGVRG